MRSVNGSCSCESIRYRVSGEPRFVAVCHCDNCRRAHGAGGVEWAGYNEDQFELLTGTESLSSWLSQTEAIRNFCSACGSPLLFRAPRWPGEVHVAVATLNGDPGMLPRARVYSDRPPAWLPVPNDELPHLGGDDGVTLIEEGG